MAQYLSADLRIRVIGAVEAGMSRNAAARRFGVSIASAVRWMDEYPRPAGQRRSRAGATGARVEIEAQAELLMRAIDATPDITLAELRERLITERGETFALSTMHDFYRRHRITFKKDGARRRAREDVAARREAWFDLQPELDPAKLVFIDETGATTKMARLRGRSPPRAMSRRGSPWPLEDHHAGRGPAPRRPHGTHDRRRGDERRRLHSLCRDLPHTTLAGDIVILDNLPPTEVSGAGRRSSAPAPASCPLPPYSPNSTRSSRSSPRSRRSSARPPQDGGCPRSGHRLRPRRVPSRRVRKLLHKLGLRARLIRKCPGLHHIHGPPSAGASQNAESGLRMSPRSPPKTGGHDMTAIIIRVPSIGIWRGSETSSPLELKGGPSHPVDPSAALSGSYPCVGKTIMGNPISGERSAVRARISAFDSPRDLDRGSREDQLAQVAGWPGMRAVAGFPDLHPGRFGPIGAAFLADRIGHNLSGRISAAAWPCSALACLVTG